MWYMQLGIAGHLRKSSLLATQHRVPTGTRRGRSLEAHKEQRNSTFDMMLVGLRELSQLTFHSSN